jgi:amino acid adenylation domain-containing protein
VIERLQDYVTAQAEARPDAIAVAGSGARWTYGRLEAQSNRIARRLADAGCRRGDRVCLLMPKSPMAIAAILGIYKADCLFVPLDPSSPAPRLERIVRSCECRAVVTRDGAEAAFDAAPARLLALRDDGLDLDAYAPAPVPSRSRSGDPAHILFTSGSTGAPKGVVITHANVVAFVEWARRYFGMTGSDRVSGHSPLHFDLSTFDIFGAFASGAELHLVAPELNVLPHRLAAFIRDSQLTQWFSVPSTLNYLAKFDACAGEGFPALRRVIWCGEVFPTPALIYWMSRVPHASFTNLYGPTEATIASSFYTLPRCPVDPAAEIPIGRPCGGEELRVLDERLDPVAAGDIGDLYIGGAGLSPGYWHDRERTEAVFVSDPCDPARRLYKTGDLAKVGSDGLVYFVGRADTQIKSRGYRIELGEIEAALNTIDGLQEAAVVGLPTDGFEGTAIACAYAPSAGRALTPTQLRAELRRLVPPYMLPSRWMALPGLPKNGSGKIDRRLLRERFQADDARTA